MAIPLALLLPLVPALVKNVLTLIRALRDNPETPAETKAKLDALQARLEETAQEVQALIIHEV